MVHASRSALPPRRYAATLRARDAREALDFATANGQWCRVLYEEAKCARAAAARPPRERGSGGAAVIWCWRQRYGEKAGARDGARRRYSSVIICGKMPLLYASDIIAAAVICLLLSFTCAHVVRIVRGVQTAVYEPPTIRHRRTVKAEKVIERG